MFSTLLGALPPVDVAEAVRALEDAGLELLSSGRSPADPAQGPDAIVTAWRSAATGTGLPVKAALVGPFSGAGDPDGSHAAAERTAEAIAALAAAGCPFIDVVEPDLSRIVREAAERDRFVDAHRWLFAALGSTAPGIHCSLVAGGGNLDGAGAATFFELPYPSYAFDLIDGPDNWRLVAAAPGDRGIVAGALAARPDGDETREVLVWAAQYAASTGGRGLDRVGLANAGSLAELPWDVAIRKVRRVAEAARIAANAAPDEVARQLDPRAFGGRRARPRGAARGRSSG